MSLVSLPGLRTFSLSRSQMRRSYCHNCCMRSGGTKLTRTSSLNIHSCFSSPPPYVIFEHQITYLELRIYVGLDTFYRQKEMRFGNLFPIFYSHRLIYRDFYVNLQFNTSCINRLPDEEDAQQYCLRIGLRLLVSDVVAAIPHPLSHLRFPLFDCSASGEIPIRNYMEKSP